MEVNFITFTSPPVIHVFPAIYEGLGLPNVSAYTEQSFLFGYTLGKDERTGKGSIRLFKKTEEMEAVITEKLPGIGPIKLQTLKDIILSKAKELFLANIQGEPNLRKVYHTHFRKSAANFSE